MSEQQQTDEAPALDQDGFEDDLMVGEEVEPEHDLNPDDFDELDDFGEDE